MLMAAAGAGEDAHEIAPLDQTFTQFVRNGTYANRTFTTGIDTVNNTGAVLSRAYAKGWAFGSSDYNVLRNESFWPRSSSIHPTTIRFDFTGAYGSKYYTGNYMSFGTNGHSYTSAWQQNSTYNRYLDVVLRTSGRFYSEQVYAGDGTTGRKIAHGLGCEVGAIFIKNDIEGMNAMFWHKDLAANTVYRMQTNPNVQAPITMTNMISVNDTHVTLNDHAYVNGTNKDYIIWCFANDPNGLDNDGTGKIACGSYTGSTSEVEVDLGWHPSFLLVKNQNSTSNINMVADAIGFHDCPTTKTRDLAFNASTSIEHQYVMPTGTGFKVAGSGSSSIHWNVNGSTFNYIAIRSGGESTLTSSDQFFEVDNDTYTNYYTQTVTAGFAPDMFITKSTSGSNTRLYTRLFGRRRFNIDGTGALVDGSPTIRWDNHDGLSDTLGNPYATFMWKRWRHAFDIVTYSGTGSAQQIPHNLGSAPAMMLVKSTTHTSNPSIYHKSMDLTAPEDYVLFLDTDYGPYDRDVSWNDTAPTATHFSVGPSGETGYSGREYVAYLFGEVSGITKMGRYSGNNSSVNVDCGFSNAAKFVLIKELDNNSSYWTFGGGTGIVSGNTTGFRLDSTGSADVYDYIDPYSTGFTVNNYDNKLSVSGKTYIYYAISS